jgi:hypothetical protein
MKKIGEVVSASVLSGIEVKLHLENPEELKVGYPVIVEGKKYSFFCIVQDIFLPRSEIIERIAGSELGQSTVPLTGHEGYGGGLLSSRAKLKPIQLIDEEGGLNEPETVPFYLSGTRLALPRDVERIYRPSPASLPIGHLRGIEGFPIPLDFARLVEKPFGLFGRTGVGKSILSKILCSGILSRGTASLLLFDMHQEYGVFSRTDHSPGLKYFFPEKVEMFTLDPEENPEARPLFIDPKEIRPSDLIVAFQDLSESMIDGIYAVDRSRGGKDLLTAIREATPEEYEGRIHGAALQALQRRIARLRRFEFLRKTPSGDLLSQMTALIREGKSIVLDFGRYGKETLAYLFLANLLARRFYGIYTERSEGYPRLVIFLEEAHKFLDSRVASHSIFDKLARETRKFQLILALVDQRPSRIGEEVRSQLANRFILSLKEPSDVSSSLAGTPDRGVWEGIVSSIPPRNVLVVGDAIRVPTVVEVMEYTAQAMKALLEKEGIDRGEMDEITARVDELFDDLSSPPGSGPDR